MDINLEIQESIKKNLPAQVGEVLKERLQKADEYSERVKTQEALINRLKETETSLRDSLSKHAQLDVREADLDRKDIELTKVLNELEISKLKYQLESEQDKTKFAKDVALGLVRNIEYRRHTFNNENIIQNYSTNPPTPLSKNKDTNDSSIAV